MVGIFIGILVVGAIVIPPTTSPQTSNQPSQTESSFTNSQSASIPPTQTAFTTLSSSSSTVAQVPPTLLLSRTTEVFVVNSQGGRFQFLPAYGGIAANSSELQRFSFGQFVNVSVVFQPLNRVIYRSAGYVALVTNYYVEIPVMNQTIAALPVIPASWNPHVGDEVITTYTTYVGKPLVGISSCTMSVYNACQSARTPGSVLNVQFPYCCLRAGASMDVNMSFDVSSSYHQVNVTSLQDPTGTFLISNLRTRVVTGYDYLTVYLEFVLTAPANSYAGGLQLALAIVTK